MTYLSNEFCTAVQKQWDTAYEDYLAGPGITFERYRSLDSRPKEDWFGIINHPLLKEDQRILINMNYLRI